MELTTEQAAERIGMSVDDLLYSRIRGLSPGILGYTHGDGKVYFDSDDLLPPPTIQDLKIYGEAESHEDAPDSEPSLPAQEDAVEGEIEGVPSESEAYVVPEDAPGIWCDDCEDEFFVEPHECAGGER